MFAVVLFLLQAALLVNWLFLGGLWGPWGSSWLDPGTNLHVWLLGVMPYLETIPRWLGSGHQVPSLGQQIAWSKHKRCTKARKWGFRVRQDAK